MTCLVDITAHAQWVYVAATASLVSPGFAFMFSVCTLLNMVIQKYFIFNRREKNVRCENYVI